MFAVVLGWLAVGSSDDLLGLLGRPSAEAQAGDPRVTLTPSSGTGAAFAPRTPPPAAHVPAGYTLEQRGTTRWLYPSAAEAEIDRLEPLRQRTWKRLASDLGVYLPPDIDIRIALNPEQMQQLAPAGRRLPAYATGVALADEGIVLLTMTEPDSWLRPNLGQVLAHELAHVALHRAVGRHAVPRWLTEGFAIHEADEHSIARMRTLWEGTFQGKLHDLSRLSANFPDEHRNQVDLAYAQAADLVGMLLGSDFGPQRFRALVTQLRAGRQFEEAVLASYGVTLDRIEQRWRAQLAQRFGSWPTVLGGLTVVWAFAAILLVIGYIRVRRRQAKTLERWAIEEAPLLAPVSQPPPPPPPTARTPADDVLDAWGDRQHRDPGVPTIVHEGRSYTLH